MHDKYACMTKKRCSGSLAIRELQIQTAMSSHCVPIRTVTFENTIPNAGQDAEKQSVIHCWWERKMVQPP